MLPKGVFRNNLQKYVKKKISHVCVLHRARTLSNKVKNDREDSYCYIQLCVDLTLLDIL